MVVMIRFKNFDSVIFCVILTYRYLLCFMALRHIYQKSPQI